MSYVGHSQGTTQAFAGFSEDLALQSKVNFFGGLAPVAYEDHETSLLLRVLSDLDAQIVLEVLGIRDFLPDGSILQDLAPTVCEALPWACDDILFLIMGAPKNLNRPLRVPSWHLHPQHDPLDPRRQDKRLPKV